MMDGFNLDLPLVCEGIIGDGCGGGRIFYIEDNRLFAYDPTTKKSMFLLDNLYNAKLLTKNLCLIKIQLEHEEVIFDLSKLK